MKQQCDVAYQDILKPHHTVRTEVAKHLSSFDTTIKNASLFITPSRLRHPSSYVSGSVHSSTLAVQDILFLAARCKTVYTGDHSNAMRYQDILFTPSVTNNPLPVAIPHTQDILKPKSTKLLRLFSRLRHRHRCSITKIFVTTTRTKNVLSRLLYCCLQRCSATKIFSLTTNYNLVVHIARKD